MDARLPPAPFLHRALLRGATVWLFLRAVLYGGSHLARPPIPMPDALTGTPLTSLWVTALTVAAVRFEMWRHREVIFLRNLGVAFTPLAVLVAAISLALDLALRVGLG